MKTKPNTKNDVVAKCKQAEKLLTDALQKMQDAGYTKLNLKFKWNPTQTVEVEPPEEEMGIQSSRESRIDPL
jgi:hypothetical protein